MSNCKIALESVTKFCPRTYFRASEASVRIKEYITHLENEAWKCDGRPEEFECTPDKFPHGLREQYVHLKGMVEYLDNYAVRICQLACGEQGPTRYPATDSRGRLVMDETKFRHVTDNEVYDPVAEDMMDESKFVARM